MSWEDNIKSRYKITTGDGNVFYVLWRGASQAYEYNISQFEFIGIGGTLADRREPKGRTFPIEIYFVGEKHLVDANDFRLASYDKRPWTIEHPLYGTLTVQPISLNFDNTESVNYTKITGSVIETILIKGPQIVRTPIDEIEEMHIKTIDASAAAFAIAATPVPADMSANNKAVYEIGKSKIAEQSEANEYFNAFTEAENGINEATAEPLAAIRGVQSVVEAPARFAIDVDTRIDLIRDQANSLLNSMGALISTGIPTIAEKALFENNVLSLISTMALAASLPQPNDYEKTTDVLNVINKIVTLYNNYVSVLGQLQVGSGANPGDYNPNADSQIALNTIVNYAVSNLFAIALDGKQERSLFLDEDSNMIVLAHRFYGPGDSDTNILKFINENDIGLNEYLGIKKGRLIKYYI